MGRGRQKAKQRKVARNLKYNTQETDYAALERELRTQNQRVTENNTDDDGEEDPYAAYYTDDDDKQ